MSGITAATGEPVAASGADRASLNRRLFLLNALAAVATTAMAATAVDVRRAEAQTCLGDRWSSSQRCTRRIVRCPTCREGHMVIGPGSTRLRPTNRRPRHRRITVIN